MEQKRYALSWTGDVIYSRDDRIVYVALEFGLFGNRTFVLNKLNKGEYELISASGENAGKFYPVIDRGGNIDDGLSRGVFRRRALVPHDIKNGDDNLVLELHSIKHEQLESEKVKVGQVVKIDKMAEINGDSSLATNSSLGFIGSTAARIIFVIASCYAFLMYYIPQ